MISTHRRRIKMCNIFFHDINVDYFYLEILLFHMSIFYAFNVNY